MTGVNAFAILSESPSQQTGSGNNEDHKSVHTRKFNQRRESHVYTLTSTPTTTNGCRTQGWESEKSRPASLQVPGRRNPLVGMFVGESGRSLLISSAHTDTTFTCLFCHHDNSVNIRVDRKEGVALLVCKVCDQRYQSKVNRTSLSPQVVRHPLLIPLVAADLTEAIDIYSEWIDAADAAQNEAPPRRAAASSSRAMPRAVAPASDDD